MLYRIAREAVTNAVKHARARQIVIRLRSTAENLALTVSAMRYISDLHIGRVNPQHFKFGLDVGPKKFDLAEFLRSQVLPAPDVGAVIATVEREHGGYRRAEAALAQYLKLAAEGDGDPVPVPAQSVRPGGSFTGMPQLARRLSLRRVPELHFEADLGSSSEDRLERLLARARKTRGHDEKLPSK